MKSIWLKTKVERSVKRRHPWVYSGGVQRVEGDPPAGDLVRVLDTGGNFLAYGHYHPQSQIRIRLLDWDEGADIGEDWWTARLLSAQARRRTVTANTNAYRLAFAESDGLPGLVADWYDGLVVLTVSTPGMDRVKNLLAEILSQSLGATGVFERSDTESRRLEGLASRVGPLIGPAPPTSVDIQENGHSFLVDVVHGQKTGFFLDQRVNRCLVGALAANRHVLDCFAYTGGFSVYAAIGGAASITQIEASAEAAELGQANLRLNGLESFPNQTIIGDVFKVLRKFRDQGLGFDLIILDPPKFAPTKAQTAHAARGYKDVNLLSLKLLRPGGLLATFSCSQAVDDLLFQKIVFGAAQDAGRPARIIQRLSQGPDHPVLLSFPESWYLKGLIVQVE